MVDPVAALANLLPSSPEVPPLTGGPRNYGANYIFWWNNVALELNRLVHTIGGPMQGPPLSARALGVIHISMHDAYLSILRQRIMRGYSVLTVF